MWQQFDPCCDTCKLSATFECPQIGNRSREFRSKPRKRKSAPWRRSRGAELLDVIVDGGESAKSLNRPGLQRLLDLINAGKVESVIVAKLDRLTRSVKDLCGLLNYSRNAKWRWFPSRSRSIPAPRRDAW
jgi:hypothetical protein